MPPSTLFQVPDGTHKLICIVPCGRRAKQDVLNELWRHVLYVALHGVDEGVLGSHEVTHARTPTSHSLILWFIPACRLMLFAYSLRLSFLRGTDSIFIGNSMVLASRTR